MLKRFFGKALMFGLTFLLGGLLFLMVAVAGYGVADSVFADSKIINAEISDIFRDGDDSIFTDAHLILTIQDTDKVVELVVEKTEVKSLKKGQEIKLNQKTNYFTKTLSYTIFDEQASEQ